MIRMRVKYSKQGLMKFIGHLDMMRYFQKACRRAGIDVTYTEGMSPHMSMSFAFPLGVGMTSDSEYVDVDINTPLSGDEIIERLNRSAPEGIRFLKAAQIGITKAEKGMNLVARADYTLSFREGAEWDDAWKEDFVSFLASDTISVMKKGKRTEKEINIRPLIYESDFTEDGLMLGLCAGNENNIRPELVMQAFAEATGRTFEPFMFRINRDEVYADTGDGAQHCFVPLIDCRIREQE